jgi:hypothetical protein
MGCGLWVVGRKTDYSLLITHYGSKNYSLLKYLQFEITLHGFGHSYGMVGHFVKKLDKVGKLICRLDCSGVLCEDLFLQ